MNIDDLWFNPEAGEYHVHAGTPARGSTRLRHVSSGEQSVHLTDFSPVSTQAASSALRTHIAALEADTEALISKLFPASELPEDPVAIREVAVRWLKDPAPVQRSLRQLANLNIRMANTLLMSPLTEQAQQRAESSAQLAARWGKLANHLGAWSLRPLARIVAELKVVMPQLALERDLIRYQLKYRKMLSGGMTHTAALDFDALYGD